MCCAVALLGILGPRALIIFWWLMDPARWALTFAGNEIASALGFLFFPWATLMYVLAWQVGGPEPIGWVFVVLGFLADFGTYTGGGYGNRDRMQSYYKS